MDLFTAALDEKTALIWTLAAARFAPPRFILS
jgi:hypothetical protein